MKGKTSVNAQGKWTQILQELLGDEAISRKHGPCPICGGKDRYRYDNKQNNGDWFCNVCGPGDGFDLLQGAMHVSFRDAAGMVDRLVHQFKRQPFSEAIDVQFRRKNLRDVWLGAKAPSILINHLRGRSIPEDIINALSSDIRGTNWLHDYKAGTVHNGVVALIRNKQGEAVSIHRTYLDTGEDKSAKKIMPPIETITGGYIRLGEPTDTLIVAEGIETALSAWAIHGHPAWACISAHNLEVFTAVPQYVKNVLVVADNDFSFTGQAAAFRCANRLRNTRKLNVSVSMPKRPGYDMSDELMNGALPYSLHRWYGVKP